LPYALLLVSLLVFGFAPKLLTEKINPDAQKIVEMADVERNFHMEATRALGKPTVEADSEIQNPQSAISN
jgi:hypothetical protein